MISKIRSSVKYEQINTFYDKYIFWAPSFLADTLVSVPISIHILDFGQCSQIHYVFACIVGCLVFNPCCQSAAC